MVVAMFGFGYVLVPIYDVFCDITGLGGRTGDQAVQVTEAPDVDRTITLELTGSVNQYAPWRFRPVTRSSKVHPGKLYRADFIAENLTDRELTGTGRAECGAGLRGEIPAQDRVLLLRAAALRTGRDAGDAGALHHRSGAAGPCGHADAFLHVLRRHHDGVGRLTGASDVGVAAGGTRQADPTQSQHRQLSEQRYG
jgi:hypothetical protein